MKPGKPPSPKILSLEEMWTLHQLAYGKQQDGTILRRELELLYPGETISLLDATKYLVVGYFYNQLAEFHKFVEGIRLHNG